MYELPPLNDQICKSNYGGTKTYAQWIEDATGLLAVDIEKVRREDINNNDTIVIGCPVFAGKPISGKWLKKQLAEP